MVEEPDRDSSGDTASVVIWTPEDPVHCAVAKAALEEAGIPVVVDSFPYPTLALSLTDASQLELGWGPLRVPRCEAERALRIIQDALGEHCEAGGKSQET